MLLDLFWTALEWACAGVLLVIFDAVAGVHDGY
jgi:hypothetical protein